MVPRSVVPQSLHKPPSAVLPSRCKRNCNRNRLHFRLHHNRCRYLHHNIRRRYHPQSYHHKRYHLNNHSSELLSRYNRSLAPSLYKSAHCNRSSEPLSHCKTARCNHKTAPSPYRSALQKSLRCKNHLPVLPLLRIHHPWILPYPESVRGKHPRSIHRPYHLHSSEPSATFHPMPRADNMYRCRS